ncbi:MAG: ABC transporter permease, partial [Chloroflexi bacterium]|nr:ABC transporter permease [Chloroflexota bacterium]
MIWQKVWLVLRREYLFNFKRPSFLFTAFGVPALSLGAMFFIFQFVIDREQNLDKWEHIGYVDRAGITTAEGPNPDDYVLISAGETPDAQEESGKQQLLDGTLDAYFVIPEYYTLSGQINLYARKNTPEVLKEEISDFMRGQIASLAPDTLTVSTKRLESQEFTLRDLDNNKELTDAAIAGRLMLPFIFVMLYFMATNTTAQFLMSGVVEEKENRLMEILATSLRPIELLWGKLLGLGALSLTQVGVWLAAGLAIGSQNANAREFLSGAEFQLADILLIVALFLINFVLYSAMMLGIGASVTAETESRQFAGIFSLLSVLPLMLLGLFFSNPDGIVPVILTFFPLTAATALILRLGLTTIPTWQIVTSVAIQVVSVIGIMWLAAKVFRLGMLMYGKPLTPRALIQALREGKTVLTTTSDDVSKKKTRKAKIKANKTKIKTSTRGLFEQYRWIQVFRYELRQQFRSKAYLFVTFGLPLIALLAFYGYQLYEDQTQSKDDKPVDAVSATQESVQSSDNDPVGYVDETAEGLFPAPDSYPELNCSVSDDEAAEVGQGGAAAMQSALIKRISSPYCLNKMIYPYASRAEGEKALDDGTISVLYVIRPDYAETGHVDAYMEAFNIEGAESQSVVEDFILRSLLYTVEPQDYEALYLRLREPAFVAEHKITDSGAAQQENEGQNFILVYGFGLTMMLGIFWGGGYLMQSVVQEKESRIIEIVLSSVQPTPLLLGKILAMGLIALLQVGMMIGTFVFIITQAGDVSGALGDVEVKTTTIVLGAVYFGLGFLLFGSLMAAIGALSSTMRESQNLVVVVTLPAAIPFFFLTIFAEEPNSTLAVVCSIFPLTASLSMIMRLSVADVPTTQIILSIVVLVVSVIGAIWFAGRLFRVNTLLRGSTPKLR